MRHDGCCVTYTVLRINTIIDAWENMKYFFVEVLGSEPMD